jgi:plasmid stabilization system protein ParE
MTRKIRLHPEALVEATEAVEWYYERSPAASTNFERDVEQTLDRIVESPELYPSTIWGVRFCRLTHFPYLVFYRFRRPEIFVFAISHERRHPRYWRSRLKWNEPE